MSNSTARIETMPDSSRPLPPLKIYLLISLGICLIQIVLRLFAGDGTVSNSEPDTTIYTQYARAICNGTPYEFYPGSAPTTGSTSHLYPFIIALFYKLGAVDGYIFIALLIFNSALLLGTLALFYHFVERLAINALLPAMLLTVFSGQLLNAFFGLTDMGLFAFLTMAVLCSLLYGKTLPLTLSVILLSLSRPEGLYFSGVLFAAGAGRWLFRKSRLLPTSPYEKAAVFSGLAGLVVFSGILLLNRCIAGDAQFTSIFNKSYPATLPLSNAVHQTLLDAISLFRRFFLSDPVEGQYFYSLPVIAAIFGVAGILLHDRRNPDRTFIEWIAAGFAAISIASVAAGGFQGVSADRYLAWLTPLWLMYVAIGTVRLLEKRKTAGNLAIGVLVAFQLLGTGYIFADIYNRATYDRIDREFLIQLNASLPENKGIGTMGGSGLQYYVKDHEIHNLFGITSPAFIYKGKPDYYWFKALETIKHEPEHAFSYWLLRHKKELEHPFNLFCGSVLAAGTDHLNLYQPKLIEADWSALRNTKPANPPATKRLIGSLDIGYDPHEKQYQYSTYSRIPKKRLSYGVSSHPVDSQTVTEVGLMIAGYEVFTMPEVDVSRDLHVVLRTDTRLDFIVFEDGPHSSTVDIVSPLRLNVLVDDQPLAPLEFRLEETGYSEISFVIPAGYLTYPQPEIVVGGDHVSYAYWFYQ
jgi:hypothetical protein